MSDTYLAGYFLGACAAIIGFCVYMVCDIRRMRAKVPPEYRLRFAYAGSSTHNPYYTVQKKGHLGWVWWSVCGPVLFRDGLALIEELKENDKRILQGGF